MTEGMMSRSRSRRDYGGAVFSDDILREVLIRLPLKSVFTSKCVSKRWNHLISDPCFRSSYGGSADFCCSYKILTMILILLPLKSVFICKCVSKRWHHLICDPRFRNSYVSLHQQLLCRNGPINLVALPPPKQEYRDIIGSRPSPEILNQFGNIICSSNGLLLCGFHLGTYYIFNPITKKSYHLPLPPRKRQQFFQQSIMGLVVAEDCDDASSIPYKVVHSQTDRSNTKDNSIEIETFSSETGEWRQSTVAVKGTGSYTSLNPPIGTIMRRDPPIQTAVIRGAIHWLSRDMFNIGMYDPYKRDDFMEIITIPPLLYSGTCVMGESIDGLLQLVALDISRMLIKVWVFHSNEEEADERQWSFIHELQLGPLPTPVDLVGFHPYNPEAVIMDFNGSIFLCHVNATPRLEVIQCIPRASRGRLHPYRLPLWPISPYPNTGKIDGHGS